MEDFDINWLAIAAASILPLVTGFIWYNPKVFGTAWMKESGMTMEKAQQMNPAKTSHRRVPPRFVQPGDEVLNDHVIPREFWWYEHSPK